MVFAPALLPSSLYLGGRRSRASESARGMDGNLLELYELRQKERHYGQGLLDKLLSIG